MSHADLAIAMAVLGAAVVTYLLRIGGLLVSERLPRNGPFRRFMDALPGTILLSLIAPGIMQAGPWGWIAAASTAACAYRTGNVLLSMLAGMAIMIVQRNWL